MIRGPPRSSPFPCPTLFRSEPDQLERGALRLRGRADRRPGAAAPRLPPARAALRPGRAAAARPRADDRSEEHTSELQSRPYLVCRLLLEKKNTTLEQSIICS